MKTGRNDPCPCGSGKKYKHCCMNKQGWAQSPAELTWRRMRKQLDGLPMRMLEFVGDVYGPVAIVEAWEAFTLWDEDADAFGPGSPQMPVFIPWFLHCWSPDPDETDVVDMRLHDVVPAQTWLDNMPHQTTPMLRTYVQSCIDHPFSFYEVENVEPGHGVILRDLITGERHDLIERSASRDLTVHHMLYAQLACVEGITLIEALGPVPFPPSDKVPVIELRKRIRENMTNPPDDATHADPRAEWDFELRELYLSMVNRILCPSMPEVVTSEGDAWEFHKLVYDIDSAQTAFDALKDLDVLSDDPDAGASAELERDPDGAIVRAQVAWNTPDADGGAGSGTLLGTIAIDGKRLTADISSRERAERLKDIIEVRLADHARFRVDTIQTPEQMLANAPEQPPSPPTEHDDPEVQAIIADHLREHYTTWIDTPVPALDDHTPRDVARTPDGREQVAAMLDGAEGIDIGLPAATRKAIFDDVREQLGLMA